MTHLKSKKLIRKQLSHQLSSLSQHDLHYQSNNVLKVLRNLEVFKQCKKIAFYMNMDTSEIKTMKMIKECYLKGNIEVYLPHCYKIMINEEKLYPNQVSKLIFYKMESMKQVEILKPQGKYGIKEPISGKDLMDTMNGLDLMILPAMAFTKKCYRLGHGVGFYDDYIKRHYIKYGKKPYLLGIGLKEQLLDDIPLEDHDEKLDGIIIDDTFYGNDYY